MGPADAMHGAVMAFIFQCLVFAIGATTGTTQELLQQYPVIYEVLAIELGLLVLGGVAAGLLRGVARDTS